MDTNDKKKAAQKLVKLLNLYHNKAATDGEKQAASDRILSLCKLYNLKIEGFIIKDLDKPLKQEQPNIQQYKPREDSNKYVIYNGKKYYNGVPKSVWMNKKP